MVMCWLHRSDRTPSIFNYWF